MDKVYISRYLVSKKIKKEGGRMYVLLKAFDSFGRKGNKWASSK